MRLSLRQLSVPAAVGAALLAFAIAPASAGPDTDSQGFVDSTARCASPDTAAAFGSTATSRVAICATGDGKYEYRGVRIRDGAKLILPATQSSNGGFVAENDGITYTFTSSSLTVSADSTVIRQESMVDYHGPQSTAPTSTAPSSASPTTTSPTTTSTAPTQPSAKPEPAPNLTPNLPPLPAEVGGSGSKPS